MKIACKFALFTLSVLSVLVKGNLIAAMARPAILSFGTLFAALNHEKFDIKPIEWRNIMPFVTTTTSEDNFDDLDPEEFKTILKKATYKSGQPRGQPEISEYERE